MRLSIGTILLPTITVLSMAFTMPAVSLAAEGIDLPNGSKLQLGSICPVCGMKVGGELEAEAIYAYRGTKLHGFAGAAAAIFQDGKVVGFDGSRCLFTYNTMPKVYGVDVTKIAHRYVTDFLSKKFIDVSDAHLVMGTQIRGFMGFDLIPFSSRKEAEQFMAEFGGKRIIKLGTAGPEEIDTKGKH